MSKQLLSIYQTQDYVRQSELYYDDDWGNYYIYFYLNRELYGLEKSPGSSLIQAEDIARQWTSEDAKSPIICHKFDYLIAKIQARAIEMRKVLKY
jgi:hypothetical protein